MTMRMLELLIIQLHYNYIVYVFVLSISLSVIINSYFLCFDTYILLSKIVYFSMADKCSVYQLHV
jgi:hypothetical protein